MSQSFILRSIKKTTRLKKTVDILKNSFYKQFREFSRKHAWKNTWFGKVALFQRYLKSARESHPAGIYLFKVNENTMCEIWNVLFAAKR